jgi:hypothetical protein
MERRPRSFVRRVLRSGMSATQETDALARATLREQWVDCERGSMKGVARMRFPGAMVLVPARTFYEHALLFEHLVYRAWRDGSVEIELDGRACACALPINWRVEPIALPSLRSVGPVSDPNRSEVESGRPGSTP